MTITLPLLLLAILIKKSNYIFILSTFFFLNHRVNIINVKAFIFFLKFIKIILLSINFLAQFVFYFINFKSIFYKNLFWIEHWFYKHLWIKHLRVRLRRFGEIIVIGVLLNGRFIEWDEIIITVFFEFLFLLRILVI